MAYARLCLLVALSFVAPSSQQDPIRDFCRRWDHQAAVIDSKLYIDGGMVTYNHQTSNYTNDYLLASDLNTPRTGKGLPSQVSNLTKPAYIPRVSGGYIWADETNKCFYQVAGEFVSGAPKDFSLWTYDAILDQWNSTNLDGADRSLQRVSFGAGAQDDSLGRGFYYGGWLNSRTTPGWTGPPLATNGMLQFDFTSREIKNISNSDQVGRAEGQMVFVPVSDSGMLIYFGGIEDPFRNGSRLAANMTDIRIYDIKSSRWYNQTATGDIPLARRQFCAGITWADDRSSYNIYLYGGYGFGEALAFNDVYILSIPSFKWVKAWPLPGPAPIAYPDPGGHGGCSANVVRHDQMIVIGGWFPDLTHTDCDSADTQGQHNMILGNNSDVHDTWDQYDPKLSTYAVPSQVIAAIGGGPTGGATVTAPATWGHADLPKLYRLRPTFSARTATRSLPSPTSSPTPTAGSKKHNIGAIAGGVVGGLVGLIAILCLILFCLHRRKTAAKRVKDVVPVPPAELAVTPIPHEMSSRDANKYDPAYKHHSNYSGAPLYPQSASHDHSPPLPSSHAPAFPGPATIYQSTNDGYVQHSPSPHTELFFPEHGSTHNTPPATWEQNTFSPQSPGAPEPHYSYPTPASPLQHSNVPVQPQPQQYYPPPQDPRAPSQHSYPSFSGSPVGTHDSGDGSHVTSTMTTPAHFYAQPAGFVPPGIR